MPDKVALPHLRQIADHKLGSKRHGPEMGESRRGGRTDGVLRLHRAGAMMPPAVALLLCLAAWLGVLAGLGWCQRRDIAEDERRGK